jgi:hypothetical protein
VRNRWIAALVLLALTAGIWCARRRPSQYSSAYVSDRAATLWSTTAQVRQPVATLRYGERVDILRRSGEQAEVRAADGSRGWIDGHQLMDPGLWQQTATLLARTRTMSAQAVAHTRSVSNVHIEPGRDTARIFQFAKNVPVAVFERKVVAAGASAETPPAGDVTHSETAPGRYEDWLLVVRNGNSNVAATSADAGSSAPIAGWVLAQFIALDPPSPIPDYTDAAGVNVVAWAVLDSVPSLGTSTPDSLNATSPDANGEKPQYLVAVARGGEARMCDFTGLRIYTWGGKRQRYETAYVENDICGQMPIQVRKTPTGAEFSFPTIGESSAERLYRMKQTVVRRVANGSDPPKKR